MSAQRDPHLFLPVSVNGGVLPHDGHELARDGLQCVVAEFKNGRVVDSGTDVATDFTAAEGDTTEDTIP